MKALDDHDKAIQLAADALKRQIEDLRHSGYSYEFNEAIKSRLNDPDSFEHDRTIFVKQDDTLLLITNFRSKNAFGGVVRKTAVARWRTDGTLSDFEINQNRRLD